MAEKIFLVLIGVVIKQIVDEINSLAAKHSANLERKMLQLKTYRPPTALIKGSADADFAEEERKYQSAVAPQIAKLHRRRTVADFVPLTIYLMVAVGLFIGLGYFSTVSLE